MPATNAENRMLPLFVPFQDVGVPSLVVSISKVTYGRIMTRSRSCVPIQSVAKGLLDSMIANGTSNYIQKYDRTNVVVVGSSLLEWTRSTDTCDLKVVRTVGNCCETIAKVMIRGVEE